MSAALLELALSVRIWWHEFTNKALSAILWASCGAGGGAGYRRAPPGGANWRSGRQRIGFSMGAEGNCNRLVPALAWVAGGERAALRAGYRHPSKLFGVCRRILNARLGDRLRARAADR